MIKWLIIVFLLPILSAAQTKRFSFTQPKMGSYFTITFYGEDSILAAKQAAACYALVDSLNEIYSDYIPQSELNRLSGTAGTHQWITLSPSLMAILKASRRAWVLSDRAFDISVGPVVRLWRKSRKEKQFPDSRTLRQKMKSVGLQYLLLDTVNSRAQLTQAGMQLDLGGIGQGYIAQQVLNLLAGKNVLSALVDASGDIVVSGAPPGKAGWKIAMNVPGSGDDLLDQKVLVAHKAVITSGDVYQYEVYKGKKYSHIVDPKTGYGVTNQRNATVIANDGITADWFATTCTILPISQLKKIAAKLDLEFQVGTLKNGNVIFYKTKGFDDYTTRDTSTVP